MRCSIIAPASCRGSAASRVRESYRIDKDTSGLLVVAKTDVAHEGLAVQFARHNIDRRYLAITAGRPIPPSGSVDAPLARSSANRKKMAVTAAGRGKRAVT